MIARFFNQKVILFSMFLCKWGCVIDEQGIFLRVKKVQEEWGGVFCYLPL